MRYIIPRENLSFRMFIGYMGVLALVIGAVAAVSWWRRRRRRSWKSQTYARRLTHRLKATPGKSRSRRR